MARLSACFVNLSSICWQMMEWLVKERLKDAELILHCNQKIYGKMMKITCGNVLSVIITTSWLNEQQLLLNHVDSVLTAFHSVNDAQTVIIVLNVLKVGMWVKMERVVFRRLTIAWLIILSTDPSSLDVRNVLLVTIHLKRNALNVHLHLKIAQNVKLIQRLGNLIVLFVKMIRSHQLMDFHVLISWLIVEHLLRDMKLMRMETTYVITAPEH